MGRKIGKFFAILIFLSVISYGIINVSNNLPKFIKDESPIKINYGNKSYDISINIGNYIIYVSSDATSNIKVGIVKGINKFTEKVKITAYNFKENTSKGIERLSNFNEATKSK